MRKIKLMRNMIKEFGIRGGAKIILWKVLHRNKMSGKIKTIYSKTLNKDIYVRTNTTDIYLLIDLFIRECNEVGDKEYEFEFEKNMNHVSFILDCGANIGLFSLIYSQKYPHSKIIAIEPEKKNFEILYLNTRDNDNIIALQRGVWKNSGYLKVISRDTGEWGFIVEECGKEGYDIYGVSIDEIMNTLKIPHINIVKIDIEGSELEVITENSDTWLKKIDVLIIETHERIKPGSVKLIEKTLLEKHHFWEGKPNGENRIFYRT